MNTAEIRARCVQVIDRFQHRGALREDDVRAWLDAVIGAQGEAAIWHATRAGGFGGSDIGVLVRNYSGHRADHENSAHDIVASKLLRKLPDEDTGDLRRGHANEPRHAELFYDKYGARRDVEAFNALAQSQGLRRWMRYSPDDVVLIPSSRPNRQLGGEQVRRVLIDYKAPRKVGQSEQIAFQYTCQLHQGAMICAKAGIHLDDILLSQFDWASWSLKDDFVPYDPELSKLILKAGDSYWDYVQRGELPPYVLTPKFDKQDEFVQRFGKKAQRVAHLCAVSKAFEDATKEAAAELKAALGNCRLAGTRLQLGDLNITAAAIVDHEKAKALLSPDEIQALRKKNVKREYDAEAMAQKLRELNVDPEAFRCEKLEAEKTYELLANRGEDPESFMTEQLRLSPSQFLKDQAREVVAQSYPPVADAPTAAEAANEDMAADEEASASSDDAEQDVREGQSAGRPATRTAMA